MEALLEGWHTTTARPAPNGDGAETEATDPRHGSRAEWPDDTRIPFIPHPRLFSMCPGTLTGAADMLVDVSQLTQAASTCGSQLAARARRSSCSGGKLHRRHWLGIMYVSPGYASIHDLPEGTVETKRADWRKQVYAEDLLRLDVDLEQAIANGRCDHCCDIALFVPAARSDGSSHAAKYRTPLTALHDALSGRYRCHEAQDNRAGPGRAHHAGSLAGKAALVGSFALMPERRGCKSLPGYAAIHGFPEGTAEIARERMAARCAP